MGGVETKFDSRNDLVHVQHLLGVSGEQEISKGRGPLNKYLQDHGYSNALFINISIKSDSADTGNTQSNISRLEVSFLDTSDLANVPCDGAGEAWIDKILTASNTYTTEYCRPILATAQHLEASRISQVFTQVENKAMIPGLNGLMDVIRNLTHTKFIQEESTNPVQLISLNNVFFLALQEVYSCLAASTMKHTFMDLKRIFNDLKLGDSNRRSGPRFTALVLSAIIIMAVGTAGAQRLKFRDRLKFEKPCGLQDAQKSEEACNFVESHQRVVDAHKKDEARKPEHASRKEEPGKRSEVQKSAMREVNVLKAESQAGPMQQHDAIPPSTANFEPRLYTARSQLTFPLNMTK